MKYLSTENIENKKVIVRVDYNVPVDNGKVLDDSKIQKSLKTINYLLEHNCSVILLSHFGRIKVPDDKANNTLKPVYEVLESLLNVDVKFIDNPVGPEVINSCKELKNKEVILLENTRYCDYPEKLESNNSNNLARYWASLGEVFVVDAFASLHRNHASVSGISAFLPTYYGFLVEAELKSLDPVVNDIEHPFLVFMGGAKVDDKLGYIKGLLPKCDYLLLGGGIANSFLYALGYDVSDSLCTSDELTLEEIRSLVETYKDKVILPIDFEFNGTKIYDLGERSINKYISYLQKSKTIFINGTCGKFEEPPYDKGTMKLFSALKDVDAIKIAGGGDTLNAISKFNLESNFTFLSSGGGASLEYISDGKLNAIEYIENNSFDK